VWLLRHAFIVVVAVLAACGGSDPVPIVLSVDGPPDAGGDDALVRSEGGFHPPSAQHREAAIGPRDHLSPALERAFDEEVGYVPIAPPGPGDWLTSHRESGQSFERFVRTGTNLPDEERSTLYLMPIGAWASDFVVGEDGAVLVPTPPMEQLEEFARLYFRMPVKTLPGASVEALQVTSRNHFGRRQLLTSDVLRALARRLPDDAYALIAVTMEDLYPAESWNFVFGYASLGERVGVYSFARYDPAFYGHTRDANSNRLILRRGLKVMAHEIGHMYGMEHCVHYTCVMNGSNHLEESDSKPMHLCPVCLRKLHHAVGFDPAERYRELGEFYDRVGFGYDTAWTERRRAYVADGASGS
jgi:archaemetzincin